MALDNEKVAAAIVAMYGVFDGHDWSRFDVTADLIQHAAFALWDSMTWTAEAMALYLWQHGWEADAAGNFTDISTSRVWAVVREYNSERMAVHP